MISRCPGRDRLPSLRPCVVAAPLLALGLLSASGCGISLGIGNLHRETRSLRVGHDPEAGIRVTASNGSIEVRRSAVEGAVVTAHIKAVSRERLEGAQVVAERLPDGDLQVWIEWPEGKRHGREGCSFEIELPGAFGVDLDSRNGGLHLEGLAGRARLETRNGAITIQDHDGPVDARTTNGRVQVVRATGDLEVRSSNGALSVLGAGGAVRARTSNGSVKIELSGGSPGPVEATTSNGSIHLGLGSAFAGELVLGTTHGSLDVRTPPGCRFVKTGKNSGTLTVGGEDPLSEARTSNGSIRVRFHDAPSGPLPAEAESWGP